MGNGFLERPATLEVGLLCRQKAQSRFKIRCSYRNHHISLHCNVMRNIYKYDQTCCYVLLTLWQVRGFPFYRGPQRLQRCQCHVTLRDLATNQSDSSESSSVSDRLAMGRTVPQAGRSLDVKHVVSLDVSLDVSVKPQACQASPQLTRVASQGQCFRQTSRSNEPLICCRWNHRRLSSGDASST